MGLLQPKLKKRPLKIFPATVVNDDIGSLKSLHTVLTKCLYHMLVEFEWNRMVQTTRNFKVKKKKKKKKKHGFLSHFWQSVGAILEKVPVAETTV